MEYPLLVLSYFRKKRKYKFSVFSILPPSNVVNSQVVKRDDDGRPYIAGDAEVEVFYDDEVCRLPPMALMVSTTCTIPAGMTMAMKIITRTTKAIAKHAIDRI